MDEHKINQIITILMDNEHKLSDGYEYYCTNKEVSEKLREIAINILNSIETTSTK